MIQLYTWKTPTGRKPAIMLEEVGLPYRAHAVDLAADEQFKPSFLAISPNNKIPAMVDDEPGHEKQPLFESDAILSYLAEQSGMLLPPPGPARWSAFGMVVLVHRRARPDARAPELFRRPLIRESHARDRSVSHGGRAPPPRSRDRLGDQAYIGGAGYSIADVASYPWVAAARSEMADPLGHAFASPPAIADWLSRVDECRR